MFLTENSLHGLKIMKILGAGEENGFFENMTREAKIEEGPSLEDPGLEDSGVEDPGLILLIAEDSKFPLEA